MDVNKGERGAVRAARAAEAIGARSLALLRAIDEAVEALELDIELLSNISTAAMELNAELKNNPPKTRMESVDRLVDTLRQGVTTAATVYHTAKQRLAELQEHSNLREDDGITDSCRRYIEAVADVHDALQDLAERIEEVDADFEQPLPGKFASIKDLTASLKA
jgi:hypothetical protein